MFQHAHLQKSKTLNSFNVTEYVQNMLQNVITEFSLNQGSAW